MAQQLLWLVPTGVAALLDTVADIISDEVVVGEDEADDENHGHKVKSDDPEIASSYCWGCTSISRRNKLTGEQDFMVSMVPMLLASLWIFHLQPADSPLVRPAEFVWCPQGMATVLAGVAYAAGYLWLLKAWERVPSTVIVPCLQLASPMVEMMEAALAPLASRRFSLLLPLGGSALSLRAWVGFSAVIVPISGMVI